MARLVNKVTYPAVLAGESNGELRSSILFTLDDTPDVIFVEPAMRSWKALRAHAADDGITLDATSLYDSYRPISVQRSTFYSRYQSEPTGCGSKTCGSTRWYKLCNVATAACPGTSNHGWGIAIDVANASGARLAWLEANVYDYGWSWELPDSEPWHIRYCDGDNIPAAVLAYEGDTMSATAENEIHNIYLAVFSGGSSCGTIPPGKATNSIVNKLDYLIERAQAGIPADVDEAAIAAEVAALLPSAAQIATAVNNDAAARLKE